MRLAPERALVDRRVARRRRLTQARIARSAVVSESTVSRVLTRAGLSRWRDLEPSAPSVRYEHRHPGDLVHLDTKKLGRIVPLEDLLLVAHPARATASSVAGDCFRNIFTSLPNVSSWALFRGLLRKFARTYDADVRRYRFLTAVPAPRVPA